MAYKIYKVSHKDAYTLGWHLIGSKYRRIERSTDRKIFKITWHPGPSIRHKQKIVLPSNQNGLVGQLRLCLRQRIEMFLSLTRPKYQRTENLFQSHMTEKIYIF